MQKTKAKIKLDSLLKEVRESKLSIEDKLRMEIKRLKENIQEQNLEISDLKEILLKTQKQANAYKNLWKETKTASW